VCDNVEARVHFAEQAVAYVREFGFDGIDIDWEYPGDATCIQQANTTSNVTVTPKQDISNFHLLMGELRAAIDAEPVPWADKLLLSMAAPSAGQWADPLQLAEIISFVGGHVDFINIMTYDYHGAWEKVVDANAPLPQVETTLSDFVDQYAVPAYKLNVGIGFYGHSWNVNLTGTDKKAIVPIGYPAVNGTAPVTFAQVVTLLAKEGSMSYYDEKEQVPTMWTAPDADGISLWVGYDNPKSIKAKLQVAKKRRMGGAMIWSLDQDDLTGASPLLTAVAHEILGL